MSKQEKQEKTLEQRVSELEEKLKRKKNGQRGRSLSGFTVWSFNLYREDLNHQKLIELLKQLLYKGLIAEHFNCEGGEKDHFHVTLWFDTSVGMTKENLSKQMGLGRYWEIPDTNDEGEPIRDENGKLKMKLTSVDQGRACDKCLRNVPVERVSNIENLPDWLRYLTHESISAIMDGKQRYDVSVISSLDDDPNLSLYWENLEFHDKSRARVIGQIKTMVDSSADGEELFKKVVESENPEIFKEFKNNYYIIRDLLIFNKKNYKRYKGEFHNDKSERLQARSSGGAS